MHFNTKFLRLEKTFYKTAQSERQIKYNRKRLSLTLLAEIIIVFTASYGIETYRINVGTAIMFISTRFDA